MPRIQEPTAPVLDRTIKNNGPVGTRVRNLSTKTISKPVTRDQPAVYVQDTDTDLKIKILSASVAETYIPLDLTKNSTITVADLASLADAAYIFVDDNGKPVKILASTVLRTEISWDDLTDDVKQKILAIVDEHKLIPGDHINIDEHNVISADIGVETLNGKAGHVTLSAADLNVYTKNDVYNKSETYSRDAVHQLLLDIKVDGGRIE